MDGSEFPPMARDASGRFAVGGSGRPVGARGRVSARVAQAILDHFEANQVTTLDRSARWYLPQYLQIISKLISRETPAAGGPNLRALERAEALARIAAMREAADRYEAGVGGMEDVEAAMAGDDG